MVHMNDNDKVGLTVRLTHRP